VLALTGLHGERIRLELPASSVRFSANELAVVGPGSLSPLSLDPLLILRRDELIDEVMFFNRFYRDDELEYLSYTSGRVERVTVKGPANAKVSVIRAEKVTAASAATIDFKYRFVRFGTRFTAATGTRDEAPADSAVLFENELAVDVGGVCWGFEGESLPVLDHHFHRAAG
jgi:hypothetical protein